MKTKLLILVAAFCLTFTSCVKETVEDIVPIYVDRTDPIEQVDSNLRYLCIVSIPYKRYWSQSGDHGWYNNDPTSFTNTFRYEQLVLTYIELNDYAKEVNVPYRTDTNDTFVGIDTAYWLTIKLPGATSYTDYIIW